MKIQVVIPTFEPQFEYCATSARLLSFYQDNFTSWLNKENCNRDIEVRVCIVDFRSSADFRSFLGTLPGAYEGISLILGENKKSSVDAFNVGLRRNRDADIFVYAASDTASGSDSWIEDICCEFYENQRASIIFSTSRIGAAKYCDQVQQKRIERPARVLNDNEQPNPNVVFFRKDLICEFDFSIGNALANDLGYSLVWMAKAIDSDRLLSYKLFVHHDHFIEGGRHDRGGADGFVKAAQLASDARAMQVASKHFQISAAILPDSFGKFSFSRTLPNYGQIKERQPFLAPVIYCYYSYVAVQKRLLLGSGLLYFAREIKKLGVYDFVFQRYRSKQKMRKFLSLNVKERIALVQRCFFRAGD